MPKTVTHTSEARCLGLLKAAPAALLVVNRRAEIVFLNARALALFGYHYDELVGQTATMLIPQGFAQRLIGGDTLAETDPLAQEIGSAIELVARRRDGSTFPVEIVLSLLQCTEGLLVTAIVRDVTAQRAAQKDLTQMEAKFRGLLDAVPDPLVVVNEAREIVLLNAQAEKQFGYERDELLGRNVTTIIPQGFAERMESDSLMPKNIVLAQQIGTGAELSGRRNNGDEFPIEMMLSTLEAPEGDLVTAVIRDVSVRKRAEQFLDEKITELNRSNKELEQFADVASHDLQEPLRMVASYTQLLARKYKGKLDADADDFIAYAVDGAERMQRLIQDLLTYSRLATKAQELKPTSSEEALTFALRNLDGAIEDSGAVVAYDPLPEVLADGGQLTQLFQNLSETPSSTTTANRRACTSPPPWTVPTDGCSR